MKAFGTGFGSIIAAAFIFDSEQTLDLLRRAPLQMHYNITKQGRSSLRNLTPSESEYVQLSENRFGDTSNRTSIILAPLLILLHGGQYSLDKAHELILGVNRTNIEQAEYAATHPGKTSWSVDHPLDADQDLLHALIHRLEGEKVGEGGHTGFENAKYWLAGGDKMLESVEDHVVKDHLKEFVLKRNYLHHLDLVPLETRTYSIIAGGGKRRDVVVESGTFDFFRFHCMCEIRYGGQNENVSDWKEDWSSYVDELQRAELEILFKYCARESEIQTSLSCQKDSN
jgi:hypothetical protein